MLIHNQEEIVENMFSTLKSKRLYSIPTGVGKGYILIALAKKIIEETDKKVIVSTSTNHLAKTLKKIATKHFKIDEGSVRIEIGKDNYIDEESYRFYRESGELEEYIDIDSLSRLDKLVKVNSEIFFEEFDKIAAYTDVAHQEYIKGILKRRGSIENSMEHDINITNHYYLVSKLRGFEEFKEEEYVVLIDEVHTLGEVAESILSRNFSLLSSKISLSSIKKHIEQADDFVGKVATLKNINTLQAGFTKSLNRYSEVDNIGERADASVKQKFIKNMDTLASSKTTEVLIKQLEKHQEKISAKEFGILKDNLSSLSSIGKSFAKNNDYVSMSYSSERGYPRLSSALENHLGYLNRILWSRLDMFVGVSATIAPTFSPDKKEREYALKRLGMLGLESEVIFYDKFFNRELVKVNIINKDAMPERETVYQDNFTIKTSPYYNYLIEYIHNNHNNKNSIVFCGGYKEVELLSELYITTYGDVVVHASSRKRTSQQTIDIYKKEGGILFATRDYRVGVSIEGEALENLFVVSLPYPIVNNHYWESLRLRSFNTFVSNINLEMLMALMQLLGRLQRTSTDQGTIHMLDNRIHTTKSIKNKILNILNYYGVVQNDRKNKVTPQREKAITHQEIKEAEEELDKLLFGINQQRY